MRDSGGAYNQQQSKSYQSDETVWKYSIRNYAMKKLILYVLQEKPMPYQFGYNIDDGYGNKQDRQEKGFWDIYKCIVEYIEV